MEKYWWKSLQVKIIAWSFVPTVIILSAVAWFTFYSYQKVTIDQAIKQDRELVLPQAVEIFNGVGNLINPILLQILGEIDVKHEGTLESRAQNILNQAPGLEVIDGGIYFVDQQGVIFKTSPDEPGMIGQDWSATPHFRFLKAQWNASAFTDLISLAESKKQVVCVGMAMTNQELVSVGAVYFCFLVSPVTQSAYYQQLNGLSLDPNIFLLDRNNRIIYSHDPLEIGKDLSGETYIQQLSQAEVKSDRFRIGAKEMVISYVPMSATPNDALGWAVLKEQSLDEIMQPTLAYRQLLLVLLALGVIVPVLVTAYGVRHITGPIQKLIQAARQVTAGQFRHKIEARTGDEIETLADQFNLMSEKLDDSYSSLEKKVADRTRELATLNSIISVAGHSLNLREILEDALNTTVEQMGFDAGAAFRINTDHTSPVLMALRGFESTPAIELVNHFAKVGDESTAENPPRVATYEIEDTQVENQPLNLGQSGFHELITVPLSTKGRMLGIFLLGKVERQPISPESFSLLSAVGQQIGVAMENAHLYEQAEQAAITAERNRLARELHDAVTQTLFSASLIADVIPRIWKRDPEEGMRNLEELRQLTRGALAEMRTLLLEMRPESLERPDLKTLVNQLADAFIGRVRVPVSLIIEGDCMLRNEVKIVFYRVAQEALNNIAKHSGARQVDIQVIYDPDHVNLCIKDDGLGFDTESIPPGHLGIAIMRERASSIGANLEVDSEVGLGTTVRLNWAHARKD